MGKGKIDNSLKTIQGEGMDVEKLKKAVIAVIGTVPDRWHDTLMNEVVETLDGLPPVARGRPMPYSTFLIYVFNEKGPNGLLYTNTMFGGNFIAKFTERYQQWKEEADVRANVDFQNTAKELEAFNDVEECIRNPHLSISSLFRYILAQKLAMQSLLTEELIAGARYELRKNPWLYFAFGDEFQNYMPLKWEDI